MLHKELKRKSWLYGFNVIPSLQQAISLFVFRLEILISPQKMKKTMQIIKYVSVQTISQSLKNQKLRVK